MKKEEVITHTYCDVCGKEIHLDNFSFLKPYYSKDEIDICLNCCALVLEEISKDNASFEKYIQKAKETYLQNKGKFYC